jgi:hypothetical protein
MKRLGTVVGASVLILLASACGNPQENQEAPKDTPTATSESSTPDRQPARTPPDGGEEVAEQQIDDTALPQGYPKLVWTQDDGRAVGVVAQEGGCGRASVELPEQTDTQVTVLMIETVPAKPTNCTMDLRYPKITVELDEPLGDRQIVLKTEQRKV